MPVIRIKHREKGFTQIDNRLLNDSRMSFKSKGIIAYLLSKSDNWTIQIRDLCNNSIDGKDAVIAGLRELKSLGYAKVEETRKEDGTIQSKGWVISEVPEYVADFPYMDKPSMDNPSLSNTKGISNTKKKKAADVSIPDELQCPEFISKWESWIAYRKELRKPMTNSTMNAQLKLLSGFPLLQSIKAIDEAITKGWQGLFPKMETATEKPKRHPVTGKLL